MLKIRTILKEFENGKIGIFPLENKVNTYGQLGEAILGDFEEAVECLKEKLFSSTFQQINRDIYNLCLQYEDFDNPYVAVFELQYLFNQTLFFTYKELIYKELKFFGKSILFSKEENKSLILETIERGILSTYLKLKKIDEVYIDLYQGILKVENLYKEKSEIAYYLAGYYLSGITYFKFGNKKFYSVDHLYSYLMSKGKMKKFSEFMVNNDRFFAWLYLLKKDNEYTMWMNLVNKLSIVE